MHASDVWIDKLAMFISQRCALCCWSAVFQRFRHRRRLPPVHKLPSGGDHWHEQRRYLAAIFYTGPITLIISFLVLHFNFLFVPCGRLSWLPISFLLHVKYTLSYRIVSYTVDGKDVRPTTGNVSEPGSALYSSTPSLTTVWSNYQTLYYDFFEVYVTKTVTLSPNVQTVLWSV